MNVLRDVFIFPTPSLVRVLVLKNTRQKDVCFFAAGPGLEPEFPGPKPDVLPLDDPAINILFNNYFIFILPILQVF